MARMGMDVDAVESVGRQLKQSADAVDGIVGSIDKTVSGLTAIWDGPDAQRFVQQTWPGFRKALIAAQTSVAGLGQSALNNASEQREASSVQGVATPGARASDSTGGTPAPVVSSGGGVDYGGWRARYPDGSAVDYDHSAGVQCVDLIKQYTADLYGPGAVLPANGNEVWSTYGASGHFEQISAHSTPQPGDIVCIDAWPAHMGSDANPYGHVAIVDHVDPNGTVHVVQESGSEQSRGVFQGTISSFYAPYVQGYLRPTAAD